MFYGLKDHFYTLYLSIRKLFEQHLWRVEKKSPYPFQDHFFFWPTGKDGLYLFFKIVISPLIFLWPSPLFERSLFFSVIPPRSLSYASYALSGLKNETDAPANFHQFLLTEREKVLTISSRRSLLLTLRQGGVSKAQAVMFAKAIPQAHIRVGRQIKLCMRGPQILLLSLPLNFSSFLEARLTQEGKIAVHKRNAPVKNSFVRVDGDIQKDLYRSVLQQGVSRRVALEIFRALGRSDIHWRSFANKKGRYALFYRQMQNMHTGEVAFQRLCFLKIFTNGQETVFYCCQVPGTGGLRMYTSSGEVCGASGEKMFCKPVAQGRFSSGFGWRKHPIYGVLKMHNGVDYAAPRGTPVVSSAGGVVLSLGRRGGFGKHICLSHENGYKTLYAHLDGYAQHLRPGQKIRQGQVIGYVGATGHATGPHLHFEVLYGQKHINPLAKMGKVTKKILTPKQKALFKNYVRSVLAEYQKIEGGKKAP